MTPTALLPPEPARADGTPRRVGVEIEFAGPGPGDAADIARTLFGGRVQRLDENRFRVVDTRLGDFSVALDMRLAQPGTPIADGDPLDWVGEKLRVAAVGVGRLWMPNEVVCPPVRIADLPEIDRLVTALRAGGAEGTQERPYFAFGLHFNPEIARPDPQPILDTLKAYLLLSPWLREDMGIDLTRRLSPFVDRFPEVYAALVVDPAYRPDLEGLAADYVRHNPSRNRELDLYPLLTWLVPDAMAAAAHDPRVKARPTWHWRLPDSRVGTVGWSVLPDWNRWVRVEALASDRWALDELGAHWAETRRAGRLEEWSGLVRRWMAPP